MGEKRKKTPQGEENYDTINLPNTFWMFANFCTDCVQCSVIYLEGRFSKTWMPGRYFGTPIAKELTVIFAPSPSFPFGLVGQFRVKNLRYYFYILYLICHTKLEGKPHSVKATQPMKTEKKLARELWHWDNTSPRQAFPLEYARHTLLLPSRKQSVSTLWRHVSQVNKIRWEGHRPKCYGKIKDVSHPVKRDMNYTAWINGCFEAFHCR